MEREGKAMTPKDQTDEKEMNSKPDETLSEYYERINPILEAGYDTSHLEDIDLSKYEDQEE